MENPQGQVSFLKRRHRVTTTPSGPKVTVSTEAPGMASILLNAVVARTCPPGLSVCCSKLRKPTGPARTRRSRRFSELATANRQPRRTRARHYCIQQDAGHPRSLRGNGDLRSRGRRRDPAPTLQEAHLSLWVLHPSELRLFNTALAPPRPRCLPAAAGMRDPPCGLFPLRTGAHRAGPVGAPGVPSHT